MPRAWHPCLPIPAATFIAATLLTGACHDTGSGPQGFATATQDA